MTDDCNHTNECQCIECRTVTASCWSSPCNLTCDDNKCARCRTTTEQHNAALQAGQRPGTCPCARCRLQRV